MRREPLAILAGPIAVAACLIAAPAAFACSSEQGCADVGISGHAEPQPVRRGDTSTLKITPKNNGPGTTYGIDVQVTVPKQLKIKRVRMSGDGNDHGCDRKGTFVQCYPGDFLREELAVITIKVKARKKGTYVSRAKVYSSGTSDPNGGNNQVGMTIGVKGRRG